MDDIFLKMSFCAENPPLKPQASAGKPRTAEIFHTIFITFPSYILKYVL